MAQPNSSDRIVSPPAVPGQPYDVTSAVNTDPWRKLDANAGAADLNTGRSSGDHWENNPGPWKQT